MSEPWDLSVGEHVSHRARFARRAREAEALREAARAELLRRVDLELASNLWRLRETLPSDQVDDMLQEIVATW